MTCADRGLFCGGQNGRQIAEAGLAILSPFLLAGSCRYSRDPLGIIVSPSPHDEPLGYVAVEEQNRVEKQILLIKCLIINKQIQEKHTEVLKKTVSSCSVVTAGRQLESRKGLF